MGFYGGPSLADIQGANFKWSDYVPNGASPSNSTVINYADQEVLMFTIATGSGWANGFEGDLDAFTISLNNGDSYTFDFNATQEEYYLGCGAHAVLDQNVWSAYEQAYAAYGINIDVTPSMFTSGGSSDFADDHGYWRGETDTTYDAVETIFYFNGAAGQFRSDTFTIGDIQSIEYVTRKADVSQTNNWFLSIYTVENSSNDCTVEEAGTNYSSVWYCHRIQALPHNSDQYSMSANEWTVFSTEYDRNGNNQLRFSDNGQGTHQSVNASDAPTWSELTDPNFTWADYPNVIRSGKTGQAVDYSDEPVLAIYLTMGSGWNSTVSDVDGLRISFKDGTSTYLDINGTGETAPTLGATTPLTLDNDLGACSANVSIAPPSAVDSCGGSNGSFTSATMLLEDGSTLNLTLDGQGNASGNIPVGSHTLTWVYQNDAGGPYDSATVDQSITIVDAEAPSITAPTDMSGNTDLDLCSASGLSLGNAIVTDNCAGVGAASNDAPASFALGANTVTWTVSDAVGNTQTDTQIVTVIDQQAPTLSALAPVSSSNDASACSAALTLSAPTVTDNCDQNLSANNNFNQSNDSSDTYPVGVTNVIWTVTDQGGNSGTTTQSVTVIDNEAPDLIVGADISQNNDFGVCEAQVNGLTATVSDNCLGVSVTHTVNGQSTSGTDASGIYPVGTTTITWRVTDQAGTFQVKTQDVTVVDNENPQLSALNDVSVNVSGNLCSAFVNLDAPTFIDNCGGQSATVTNDYNNTADASGLYAILEVQGANVVSNADQTANGVVSRSIVITWSGTDALGNSAPPQSMTLTLNGLDADSDEFCDEGDNCAEQYNPSQRDIDSDGEGNACDCGDGYIYNSTSEALDQATSQVVSSPNAQFNATDASEQAVNQYTELCDDGNQNPGDACTNTCAVGPNMDMISLAGGSYNIGDASAPLSTEKVEVAVSVPAFSIAKHEVTVGQYKLCVDAGVCTAPLSDGYCNWGVVGREHHPVNCISARQAQKFVDWIGARLPTESEWEFAATAGDERQYTWGATAPDCTLTHAGEETITTTVTRRRRRRTTTTTREVNYGCNTNLTAEVCSKAGQINGICDLSGNIAEWTADIYASSHTGIPTDGSARLSGDTRYQTVRGGSWRDDKSLTRNTMRRAEAAGRANVDHVGFRFCY